MKDPYSNGSVKAQQATANAVQLLQETNVKSMPGLYIHVPFCFHKCHYCDFYSIVDSQQRQEAFLNRLLGELAAVRDHWPGGLETIFVGGGTPTLLAPHLWQQLLAALARDLDMSGLVEFTVEANPETVGQALLAVLVGGGVNRLSVGCQSFDPGHLKTLERRHDPARVASVVAEARRAGIRQINLDLIFAIPGQSLDAWKADLDRAIDLEPEHLSCYGLSYEPNTPMTQKVQMGRMQPADPDLEAAMFEWTIDRLEEAGYRQYEVSNFAKADAHCRHNLIYWTNANWFSLGPSGSGHLEGRRWKNVPHLGQYLASEGPCPIQDLEHLDASGRMGERLMLGLRLRDGLVVRDDQLDAGRRAVVDQAIRDGAMVREGEHLKLTRSGMMVADAILCQLI